MPSGAPPATARRPGFGLLEILVALLLVAVLALPVVQSGTAIHHQTYLTEFDVLAAVRARTLMSVVSALDFELVHRQLAGGTAGAEVELDLAGMLEPGALEYLLAAPARTNPLYVEKTKL